jgi:hypothetical protein
LKEQLHAVGSTDVEVVADDLLEKLAAMKRPVEDLGQADLHLQQAELVAEASPAIGGGEGMREAAQPVAEEALDGFGRKRVADLLQHFRLSAGEKAVIEFLVRDAAMSQLPLGPLMAVDPDAHVEGSVGGELDEAEAKVLVEDIEVVLVHIDRAAVEREAWRLAVSLPTVVAALALLIDTEAVHLFLCHSDKHDTLASFEVAQSFANQLLFPRSFFEVHQWNSLAPRELSDPLDEGICHLLEQHRGHHWMAAVLVQEPPEVLRSLQLGNVSVQVQPVDTVDLEANVISQ